jgi:radical SAM protein with 4Fe4S-binding SPASM domain
MCPHDKIKRPKGHMSWETFKKIIGQLSDFEGLGLNINLHKDGEPLLDPLLFKRISYIKKKLKRSKVNINTNAALLSKQKADLLLDSGIDSVIFSVDGTSIESTKKIRKLDYTIIKKNLEYFFCSKKKKQANVHTSMQMVVSDINKKEANDYKKIWRPKADRVILKPMHNFLDQESSIKTKKIADRQTKRCYQIFHTCLIFYNGDLAMCCWDYDNFMKIGNIYDDNLINLYNNKKFNSLRKAMWIKQCTQISPCNRCSVIYGND